MGDQKTIHDHKHCTMQLFDTAFRGGHIGATLLYGVNRQRCHNVSCVRVEGRTVVPMVLCPPIRTKMTVWQGLSVDVDTALKKALNLQIESTSKCKRGFNVYISTSFQFAN